MTLFIVYSCIGIFVLALDMTRAPAPASAPAAPTSAASLPTSPAHTLPPSLPHPPSPFTRLLEVRLAELEEPHEGSK